jgi:uncharacterized ferritin-like protein (DUF455 family)
MELRAQALQCLGQTNFTNKTTAVADLALAWTSGNCSLDTMTAFKAPNNIPGLPSKPDLVSPKDVARRNMRTTEGRAVMIHALAHIEFNAINLALDAVWRFTDMPQEYYADWLKVAAEEAYHFTLLNEHLIKLGYVYGDFPAHNSLWEMATRTTDDILARIALVPRTMEARGLDASPALRAKVAQVGDMEAAAILDIILRDEIGHVAIGNYWFNWLCETRRLEPISTYATLAKQYAAPTPRKPFNHQARLAAGFTEQELAWLENV